MKNSGSTRPSDRSKAKTTIATPPRKNTNLSDSTPNDPDKEQHAEDLHEHYEDLLRMMGRISGLSWAEGLVELDSAARHIRPGDLVRYLPFGSFGM